MLQVYLWAQGPYQEISLMLSAIVVEQQAAMSLGLMPVAICQGLKSVGMPLGRTYPQPLAVAVLPFLGLWKVRSKHIKCSEKCLFIRTLMHSLQIFWVIPFVKLQNNI